MSRGPEPGFAPSLGDVEDARNRSVPEELVASLRSSASGGVAFEEVLKVAEAIWRRSSREIEQLRSENDSFRNALERLNSERLRLEDELRKCGADGDEWAEADRPGIGDDVYDVRVGRGGGGETSLKEVYDELRRKNEELEGEKRELERWLQVWRKKCKELDELRLERDTSMLENEAPCILGSREGASAVLGETDCLINVDACGDRGSTRHGTGPLPPVLGEMSTQTLRTMAAALKQCEQKRIKEKDSDNCLSKPTGVNPIKHDNGAGSESAKSDYRSSEQKRIKEKDSDDSLSKSTGVNRIKDGSASAKSDCGNSEQKRNKGKDSDNNLSKSSGVSPNHENRGGSASTKSYYGSSLHKECWKSEVDMLSDFTQNDELCMKAVCALYRLQRSKSMQRSACGGFDDLLSPRENSLAEFLTGGDPEGKLKKSVMNLRDHCPEGLSLCRNIATINFKQLFIIYRKKEDPFFTCYP
ncbi:hypothetical protein BT93_E0596 [Corymbia citriodora subsp. variegata]|nr:hypothetical protein BT93_E0596 [Corymbia citriodora subsp. variegata]